MHALRVCYQNEKQEIYFADDAVHFAFSYNLNNRIKVKLFYFGQYLRFYPNPLK